MLEVRFFDTKGTDKQKSRGWFIDGKVKEEHEESECEEAKKEGTRKNSCLTIIRNEQSKNSKCRMRKEKI